MSATVPSGGSQTIGSGEVGFTEPLNVAGELNLSGEFVFDTVTGTFSARRPIAVASGTVLSIADTQSGAPLNVAGELNLTGEVRITEPSNITFDSVRIRAGTFTAQRPLDIDSGETLTVTTTVAGSPLNLAGQLDLTGEVKLTDSPSITFTGIREPPKSQVGAPRGVSA